MLHSSGKFSRVSAALVVGSLLYGASAGDSRGQDADDAPRSPARSKQPAAASPSGLPSIPAPNGREEKPTRPVPTPEEFARWIDLLDDDRYLERERATQQLLAAGAAALDALLTAANSDRPEPADRAVWIMQRLGRSRDNDLAMAALERLAQLESRPNLAQKAESDLAERAILAVQQRLIPLGAEVVFQLEPVDNTGNVALVLHVRFAENWHGTPDDVQTLTKLRRQAHFRLEGTPVNDAVVKMFEAKPKLAFLQLINTKVTPPAVDSLKKVHPDATLYVRNQALLGVQAANHESGVIVQQVQLGSAAATAGILAGDVIAMIDGHKLPDFDRMTARIAQHQPGDKVDLEIIRNNERMKLSVALGSWAGQR